MAAAKKTAKPTTRVVKTTAAKMAPAPAPAAKAKAKKGGKKGC
jgi:hypothetical protein